MSKIVWNDAVRLILADVDQTIADDFLPAADEMIQELTDLLTDKNHAIFFVTGGPLDRVRSRIVDRLPAELRNRVLISHCSGAEVWGFDKDGDQHKEPFYSVYDEYVSPVQKRRWREIVQELIAEFKIEAHDVTTVKEFRGKYGDYPLAAMVEDRGPQITLEMINGYNLNDAQRAQVKTALPHLEELVDLREPLQKWADRRMRQENIPVTARFGGTWALDLAIRGVSKTESVERILSSPHVLAHIGMGKVDLSNPEHVEIWGDRFEQGKGTDWLMCKAVDPLVRAIDFRRNETPDNFPAGYNIVVWQGQHEFQDGLLEYLKSRREKHS